MWILNICVFAFESEIGALILYFTNLILGIQNCQTNIRQPLLFVKAKFLFFFNILKNTK